MDIDPRVVAVDEVHRLARRDAAVVGGEGHQASAFERRQRDHPVILTVQIDDQILHPQSAGDGKGRMAIDQRRRRPRGQARRPLAGECHACAARNELREPAIILQRAKVGSVDARADELEGMARVPPEELSPSSLRRARRWALYCVPPKLNPISTKNRDGCFGRPKYSSA